MRIFITGASGCIGHYIAETLIEKTNHELFFLVRNPDKLRFNYNFRSHITLLEGDMKQIEQFGDFLKSIDIAILIATAWGGTSESFDINVLKTVKLIELLDPERCQQVIYFSTASILDRNNQPLKQAGELGTDYIRTKYECYNRITKLNLANKITTVFPTLVFGGDENKPLSHLTSGLPEVLKWSNLIRFLSADGSFHLIHAKDIATVIYYLVQTPYLENKPRQYILGNQPTTADSAIKEICGYLGKKIYFQIPLSLPLANFFIKVFKIQMAAWDRFCLDYRHFTYQNPVNPISFGLESYCTTLTDILRVTLK